MPCAQWGMAASAQRDLFDLADAVARFAGAAVTIEDNESRVLAYSSGHDESDPARVSTIIGRRVPSELVSHFRAAGVFRRLATSDEPFLVPAGPGVSARLVVPIRAGHDWLGSLWLLRESLPGAALATELRETASVIALHLVRQRLEADAQRRFAVETLRLALVAGEGAVGAGVESDGPWRVVALAGIAASGSEELHTDVWFETLRRHWWRDPQVADVDGTVFAVVRDATSSDARGRSGRETTEPGSWPWLVALARPTASRAIGRPESRTGDGIALAASRRVDTVGDWPRARAEAAELAALRRRGRVDGATLTFDNAWAATTLDRAAAAVDPEAVGGPVATLLAHDAAHGTAYAPTLRAWLAHLGAPGQAARALDIHVNTLRHRMTRLEQVVDLDLSDPDERLALALLLAAAARAE